MAILALQRGFAAIALSGALASLGAQQAAALAPAPLRICATTTDLAALCRAVGGPDVEITAFTAGPEDPHFATARPSMIQKLNRADLLVSVGRELEIGWLPLLVTGARNPAVADGGAGRLVAADCVRALGVPTGPVDRSQGDVHQGGNPHFLTDPLCGLQVAAALVAKLTALRPDGGARFAQGLAALRRALAEALVGPTVAARYGHDAEKLLLLCGAGTLESLLREQGDLADLGGWAALLAPHRGALVVADHDLWPYFAERFGLRVIGFLEPAPGIAPTTAHLQTVVAEMRQQKVRVILSVPYFAVQHAEFVAAATGARIAAMAHQPGGRGGDPDYVTSIDANVRAVATALGTSDR